MKGFGFFALSLHALVTAFRVSLLICERARDYNIELAASTQVIIKHSKTTTQINKGTVLI